MNNDLFESKMREGEAFHAIRIPPGVWTVVRADGRAFSRLTRERFEKPFDAKFHDHMLRTAAALLEEMQALYVYTESDEISVLAPPAWSIFGREVEKIVSVSAGLASAEFTHASGQPGHFDGRIWIGASKQDVIDYFQWRQSDGTRCALNGWCYWVLRQAGKSAGEATRALEGASRAEKNELLFQHGVNFNDVPLWQRRGSAVYWETVDREGFDPIRKQAVITERRQVKLDRELPMKEEYTRFLTALLAPAEVSAGPPSGGPDDANR